MKKIFILPLVMLVTLLLTACSNKEYDIVTTLFPQYDITRTIVGDKDISYTLLLAPGVEAHDFEPTSKQIVTIKNSKLLIYTSDEMEPWVKALNNNKTVFLNLEQSASEDHLQAHQRQTKRVDEHDHDHDNLHYWVHLENTLHMINVILEEIIHLDPDNEAYYTENANQMKREIMALSEQFDQLSSTTPKEIHYIGHNLFSLLNEEKGLNITSLTDSFSPDADPTSTQIQAMLNKIMETSAKFVYFDPLESVTLANTIKDDLKSKGYEITLLPLHSMHNLSKNQFEDGVTLVSLWQENFTNLSKSFDLEMI